MGNMSSKRVHTDNVAMPHVTGVRIAGHLDAALRLANVAGLECRHVQWQCAEILTIVLSVNVVIKYHPLFQMT